MVVLLTTASAMSATSRSSSPLNAFKSSARLMSLSFCALMASPLVGFASLTTPASVTLSDVAAAYCVDSIRSMSTCGCSVPCASWPYCGTWPVSGSTVPSIIESMYLANFVFISASYCASETPR